MAIIRVLAALGLVVGTAVFAHAQDRVASFADLPMRINLGDRLTVQESGGATWRGRLTHITPEQLVLRVDGRDRVMARNEVRQVRICCDSLRNGTLIGLGAGAVLGVLVASDFSERPSVGDGLGLAMMFGAIGTGLGVGIDALIRADVVIYRAPPLTLRVAAIPAGRGAQVLLRW